MSIINLWQYLKDNLKIILEFLKQNSVEINIKHKASQETVKIIKLSNLFFVFLLLILFVVAYLLGFVF